MYLNLDTDAVCGPLECTGTRVGPYSLLARLFGIGFAHL